MDTEMEIKSSKEFGEFLVPKASIEEGQVFLVETPLFSLPKEFPSDAPVCCVACLKVLKKQSLCSHCRWPICSPECAKDEMHQAECKTFSENGVQHSKERNSYLKVVRILLAKDSPEYETFMALSSDIYKQRPSAAKALEKEASRCHEFLRNQCKMDVKFKDVLKILSTIRLNHFNFDLVDLTGNRYAGFVLVKLTCKISHSCAPNVEWGLEGKFNPQGQMRWMMRVHSRSKIQKGEILGMRYSVIGTFLDTARRRKQLSRILPFECLCSRCADPTEGETFFGSVVCRTCKKGYMLAMEALESDTCIWKCNQCSSYLLASEIMDQVSKYEDELKKIIESKYLPTKPILLDQFIARTAGKKLHENHFVLFKAYIDWLFDGDFTEALLRNDKASQKLFKKIIYRAERVNYIGTRILPTKTLVDLELFFARRTAEYVFKSPDLRIIKNAPNVPRRLYFARKVLSHLAKALQWAELNSRYGDYQKVLQNLHFVQGIWHIYVNKIEGESDHSECDTDETSHPCLSAVSELPEPGFPVWGFVLLLVIIAFIAIMSKFYLTMM